MEARETVFLFCKIKKGNNDMSNRVNLTLDVTKTGIQNPLIKVRQGDGGFETLRTTVTSNGEPLDLQGWTILFMGTTAGNHKIVDGNVTLVESRNGIFEYTPSKAWGMDIGEFKTAYFKFVKGDGSASSANFRVSVIESVDLTQEEAQHYISVVDAVIAETREHLDNSLADVSSSVGSLSAKASSAVNQVNSAASSASSIASSAVSNINSVASSAAGYIAVNDEQLVHKTRTETIDGDKTLTGKTSLLGGFTFNTTALTDGTNADTVTQSGSYSSYGNVSGLPINPAYGVLNVESSSTDTKQTFVQTNIDRPVYWTRVKNNNIGSWSNWVLTVGYSALTTSEVANDPTLVDLSTDKSMYAPYEGVTFKGYPNANSGKVNIEYWKREQKIATQTVRFSSSEVTWKWYLPSDDNEQYIAKIMVSTEGGRTSTQYYAINVASNSNNLPIMGFLSSYTTYDPKAQKRVMDWLKRTHMNYIQYYDSYYRPENLLAVDDNTFREGISDENPKGIGMAGTAADYWTDLSSHTVRKDVLQKYVELGQEYGMKNMLYIPWGNTSYVDTEHGITPEMLLFPTPEDAAAHNVKSVQATLSGGDGQWARYSLMKANPSSNEFKNMLFTSAGKALQSVGFDGLHIDTLGPIYGGVYTVYGTEYSNDFASSTGMPYFINDAAKFFNTDTWKKQGKDIRMSFNNVGSWGIEALANNQNIDYLYAEQWPDMGNKTYDNMFQHVKDIITADERGRAVIPAYIHKGFEGDGSFDVNGVILLDLIIMAAGGTHLELGEHMLRGEYFPQTGMYLGDYLKEWLTQYYDFLVAYRRMFTSRNFTSSITSSSHDIAINSIDTSKLSVIEKSDEFIQSLSLINTNGLNGDEWQDNKLDRNKPDILSNVSLKFDFTPKAVYYVTIENPIPQSLEVNNNSVVVPYVDRYVMVYAYK